MSGPNAFAMSREDVVGALRRTVEGAGVEVPDMDIAAEAGEDVPAAIVDQGAVTDIIVACVVTLLLGYAYLLLVFSFFPWTSSVASRLVQYAIEPVVAVGMLAAAMFWFGVAFERQYLILAFLVALTFLGRHENEEHSTSGAGSGFELMFTSRLPMSPSVPTLAIAFFLMNCCTLRSITM